jgi:RND superfamily putative drug exporter
LPVLTKLLTLPARRIRKFFVLAVALVVVASVGPLAGKFEDVQENETTSFLPGDAQLVKAIEAIEQFEDGEVAPAVTVIARDGGLTPADRRAARELARSLETDPPPFTKGTQGPDPVR